MATEHFETRLVAILYADVVGYSRLTEKDEESTHRTLVTYLDAMTAAIQHYGGSVVNFAGDAVLAYFSTGTDALACAVTVQQDFAARNQTLSEDAKFQFRIGLNLGDVLVDSDGIRRGLYGNNINVAARLQSLADPGGICVSDAVRTAVGTKLPLDYELIGEQLVKNIAEPVRAHRVRPHPGAFMPPPSRTRDMFSLERLGVGSVFEPTPEHVSVNRMPITGGLFLGRDEELRQLDDAWTNPSIKIITLVAWGGVGKSTLVNHWLRRMARDGYCGAARVYTWSFYLQGTVDRVAAADEFIASSLAWFGDPDPNKGTARDKGERLAKLIQQHRTLLILDGLEPLQFPPGPKEGRLVDSGLHALLCELASINPGLCLITTRLPVTDLEDFQDSHRQINLKCLSPTDGASLLRMHSIQGSNEELEQASEDFGGHCLALTLLANYLNDAFDGNILYRQRVDPLQEDIRQGGHAKRVLSSYSEWIDDAAELEVLRVMGLFDRPASAHAIQALRAFPIQDLTEHIGHLTEEEFHRVVSRLRRVGLLAERDPHCPDALDAHPLVRQFFREQLQKSFIPAWRQGNECLFNHFKNWGKQYPGTLSEMEVLFQAVVFGCKAGLHRQALHEIYFPRIMRGREYYAADVLGARGTLLSVLSHFFEGGSWGNPVEPGPEKEGLEPRDQLSVLEHVRMFLTATMGYKAPGIVACYQRIKSLCYTLGEQKSLYSVLTSDWMYSLVTEPLAVTLSRAEEILSLAEEQDDPAMLIGAYRSLSDVTYFMGNFRLAKQYAEQGIALWDAGASISNVDEVSAPVVTCLCFDALALWQLGYPDRSLHRIQQALEQAPAISNAHSLAVALHFDGYVSHFYGFPSRAADTAQRLIDLSRANGFRFWLAGAHVQLGWAQTLLGSPNEGLPLIAQGIEEWRATGAELIVPYWLAMAVEAHRSAGKIAECLPMIDEACESADRRGELWWTADLWRLKGLYFVERHSYAQGEQWLRRALELARQQGSVLLELRAAVELGKLLSTRGETKVARNLLEPLYQAVSHELQTSDLKAVQALLNS